MEKSNILLVEDDPSLGFITKDQLTEAGFDVKWCKDGKDGFEVFFKETFDICVLDVMLPKKDGFTLAKDIKAINPDIPIIFLTAKSQIDDKIKGFKTGGDDYLTKPFVIDELVARIDAILNRTQQKLAYPSSSKQSSFTIGQYQFNHKNLELIHPSKTKTLTKIEADLLRLLCIHQEQVLERDMALNIIWGKDDYFNGRSMDVFITKLRKYLKEDELISIINVHGVGFKLSTK